MTELFDSKILKAHRDYAASNMHKADFILKHAIEDAIDHIKELEWDFAKQNKVIEIGSRYGMLASILARTKADLTVTDYSQKMLDLNPAKNQILMENDVLDFSDNSADMIVSCMNLHWVNDVRSYAKEVHRILRPGGAFIANFIGDGSLMNLKNFLVNLEIQNNRPHIPHVIPMIPADKLYMLFQEAGFKFIIVARVEIDLEYDHPTKLMKDLKNMGENNAMASNIMPLPKKILNSKVEDSFKDQLTFVSLVVKKV